MQESYSEETLKQLRTFNQGREESEKNEICRKVLEPIARTGVSPYAWEDLRPALIWRTMQVIDAKAHDADDEGQQAARDAKKLITEALGKFTNMPFTMQRFCEILQDPGRYYKKAVKLAYALEKLLRVSGSLPNLSPEEYERRVAAKKAGAEKDAGEPMMMAIDVDLRPAPALMMNMMGLGGGGGGGGNSDTGSGDGQEEPRQQQHEDAMDTSD